MILPLRDLYQDDGLFWQRNCRMLCRAQDPNLDLDNMDVGREGMGFKEGRAVSKVGSRGGGWG